MGGRLQAYPLLLASAVPAALAAGMSAAAELQAAGMQAAAERQTADMVVAADMAVAADIPAVLRAAGSPPAAVPPVFFREAGGCRLLFL